MFVSVFSTSFCSVHCRYLLLTCVFDIPDIDIRPPKSADHGDYACSVAMQLAKTANRNPFDIATTIVKHLPDAKFLASAEVVKPGFINFRLNEDWLKHQVEMIITEGDALFPAQAVFGDAAAAVAAVIFGGLVDGVTAFAEAGCARLLDKLVVARGDSGAGFDFDAFAA